MQEIILGIVGFILQMVFRYFPKVKDWYDKQADKGLIMLGAVTVVSLAYFGLACWPDAAAVLKIILACTKEGFIELAKVWFFIASGNQLAYLFTKNVGREG